MRSSLSSKVMIKKTRKLDTQSTPVSYFQIKSKEINRKANWTTEKTKTQLKNFKTSSFYPKYKITDMPSTNDALTVFSLINFVLIFR